MRSLQKDPGFRCMTSAGHSTAVMRATSYFSRKRVFVFSMIKEKTSKMDDTKRLYEIIAKMKSRLQMSMASAGHSTAVMRATSYFSGNAYFQEKIAGIEFYQFIDRIESHFEEEKGRVIDNLKLLMKMIFRP